MYSKVKDIPEELITLPLKEFNKEYKKWGKIPRPILMKKRRKLQKKVNKKELDKAIKCINELQNQASKLYEEKMEALENYIELREILFGLYDNGIHVYYYPDKGYIIKKENKSIFKYLNIFNIF